MKPMIGEMLLWDEAKADIWMLPGYMEGIMIAGGIPIIFSLSAEERELEQSVETCDRRLSLW